MNSALGTTRDLILDFVKGLLVIVMVIYHVMNIFSTASSEAFGYVRFVSGSFIFISGYIISTFYEQKFHKDRIGTSKRLAVRGLKLLLLFTILNILINLTGFGNPRKIQIGVQQYLNNIIEIYTFGDLNHTSFQILLPISYLLIISPVFLLLRNSRIMIALMSLMVALYFSFLDSNLTNFNFSIIGIIGFSVGLLTNKSEVSFAIKRKPIILSCLLACIYLMEYMDRRIITYAIGIMIIIKLFYDLGKIAELENYINRAIILFGQYSLVCYIAQIIFLQVLFRVLSKEKWELGYETASIFVVTNVFLLALCFLLKFLRNQYRFMDRSYRLVFS